MVDHALIVMYEGPRDAREIPDFALDRHTARSRRMRRGWKHFWEQGASLENSAKLSDPFKDVAINVRCDAQTELAI